MCKYDFNVLTRQYQKSKNFSREAIMKTLLLIHCNTDWCSELQVKDHKYVQQAGGLSHLSQ